MTKHTKAIKYFATLPNHLSSKMISSSLSDSLREKYGTNRIRIRKGDGVKIMRGEYSGVEGKITHIYVQAKRISVEGVTREKQSSGNVPIKIHPSNVMAISLDLKDKSRLEKLEGTK